MTKQQSLTANRLASIEREMDSMAHDSSEGLRASIYLAHTRKEYAAGNYGVAEMDLDEVQSYLDQVKKDHRELFYAPVEEYAIDTESY